MNVTRVLALAIMAAGVSITSGCSQDTVSRDTRSPVNTNAYAPLGATQSSLEDSRFDTDRFRAQAAGATIPGGPAALGVVETD